jgi:hypothetical protein
VIRSGRFEEISEPIMFAEQFLDIRPEFLIVPAGAPEEFLPLLRPSLDGAEKDVPHATPRPDWNLSAHLVSL